jgi:hypothetical protein
MNRRFGFPGLIAILLVSGVASADDPLPDQISVDKQSKKVVILALVAPRKLPKLNDTYPIEVIATFAAPKGQKAHETVVTIEAKPSDVHKALVELGLIPGKAAKGEEAVAEGPEVTVSLEVPGPGTLKRVVPIERTLIDKRTGKTMPKLTWRFTGSQMKQVDPDSPEQVYGADVTGTLISIFPVTDETVLQTNLTMKDEPLLKLDTNTSVLPKEGTPVKLIIQAP